MNTMTPRFPAAIALALALTGPLLADDPAGVRLPLFNGTNLDGWHVSGCQAGVQDGLLVVQEGNGWLRTDHEYADFVLELSCRARKSEQWDSGIYLRAAIPAAGKPWPDKYQVNLKQGDEGNVGPLPKARSTGLIRPGDWNHFKITVIGSTASLEINGHKAWEADGIEAPEGYIGIQCEVPGGGQFEFKDIFVTEIGYRPLLDGKSLAGWEGAGEDAAKCWKVDEGLLLCTGDKGPWLRSTERFADFDLRLEYKLKDGGNSGVYVRVPEDGNHHGDGAGVEIQILDDQAERYKELKPYQYTGSVYGIAPAKEHVGRPPEQWNSLEIRAHGTHYRIVHNGITIVDAQESEFPELKGRLAEGFLGLQNHSEEVWFRNIRLRPLK